jgi:TM2 domain-containing membrane protein YozV
MENDGQMTEQMSRELAQMRYESERAKQRHGVPALMSFFIPGLGQLIKGHFLKGVFVWVGLGVSILLISAGIGLVTTPLVWIWQLYDAYRSPD